jgi:hypothetical protein
MPHHPFETSGVTTNIASAALKCEPAMHASYNPQGFPHDRPREL